MDNVPNILSCGECGGYLEIQISGLTASVLEEVDDGTSDQKVVLRKDIKNKMLEKKEKYLKEIMERERPYGNMNYEKEEEDR